MDKIWTIGSILQWTQQYFTQKGIDSPRLDAEILLSHVLQKERIYLYAHYDEPLMPPELAAYRELIKKRANRLSVAHILGVKNFMGLDFTVNKDVLIPRPETELLVEQVMSIQAAETPLRILDIGTGSGAIVLSLLHYLPQAAAVAVDISEKALHIAQGNAEALGLTERVEWIQSDLLGAVPDQTFDWIVSNPPYLTRDDMAVLQPEVQYDPKQALYGGPDGLEFYRRIASAAWPYMKADGHCAVEIGAGQAPAVSSIFADTGQYTLVQVCKDYGNIERVIIFRRKE